MFFYGRFSFGHQCCDRGWKIVQCRCHRQQGGRHVHWTKKDDHRLRGEQDGEGSRSRREKSERMDRSAECKTAGKKTPCVETGVCSDCSSPDRICNIYVTLAKKPVRTEVVVILVGENLGL